MTNVSLSIAGRQFSLACAPGEEAHIASLGRMIDAKLAEMEDTATLGETRLLLFGALMLADELFEVHQRQAAAPASLPDGTAARLDAIAGRLENLARHLETR